MKRTESQPATIFAALGDLTRLRLVIRLSRGEPLSIKQLAAGARMTRQAVTKHLHVLAEAGIAKPSKLGREQRWELDQRLLTQASQLLDRLARDWESRLARLKDVAEGHPE